MGGGRSEARWEDVGLEHFGRWLLEMKAKYEGLLPKRFPCGTGKASGWPDDKLKAALKALRDDMPKSRVVIKGLPQRIKDALRTNTDSIFFSADNLAKQLYYHSEITPSEYIGAIAEIKGGATEIYGIPKEYRIMLIANTGHHYAAMLKTTEDRSEAYILSLFRLDRGSLGKLLQKYGRFKI